MSDENKYIADLKINERNIDKEIIEQAQRYYEWSIAAVEAEIARDDAKDEYDLASLKMEAEVRESPGNFMKKGEKITEGAIKAAVANDPFIIEKAKAYSEARNNFKLLSKAERAFDQRRKRR